MIELKIFNEPTNERITEMIETIEDIRDAEMPVNYYDILTETSDLLKKVLRGKKIYDIMKERL